MLRINPEHVIVNGFILTRGELSAVRPEFPLPLEDEVVIYGNDQHIRMRSGRQYGGVVPWIEGDTLIADESLEDDIAVHRAPPPPTLEEAKALRRQAVDSIRNQKHNEPVAYNGDVFDNGNAPTSRVSGAATLALIAQASGSPFSMDWITADNQVVTFTPEDVFGLGAALATRTADLFHAARAHKDAIDALGTVENVQAYDIMTGWPE